jgi:two-component system, NarL family, nitrate/nitrite response regulator NarL
MRLWGRAGTLVPLQAAFLSRRAPRAPIVGLATPATLGRGAGQPLASRSLNTQCSIRVGRRSGERALGGRVLIKSDPRPRPARRAPRIFIISEYAVARDGLRLLLQEQADFRVVGVASDCVSATRPARQRRPDILLLELATAVLPDGSAVHKLATNCAPARLMVLAPRLERSAISDALQLGVHGVVLKEVPVEVLFRSIRAVAAGQYWVGREIVADLVQSLRAIGGGAVPAPKRRTFGLTARELEIVSALIGGGANKEIARRCGISEKTVKHHLTSIFDKLGLSSRLEVVLFAMHHQLVSVEE